MKNEPLKNKTQFHNVKNAEGKTNQRYPHHYDTDVKSAVEWLKEELHKNTDAKSRTSLFQVSDIIKLIDEAFPDLCPPGDLIADKQNPQDTDEEHYEEEYQPTAQEIHNLSGKAD